MRLSQQTLSVLQCRMLFSQPGLLTKSPRISVCIYTNFKTNSAKKKFKKSALFEKLLDAEKGSLV